MKYHRKISALLETRGVSLREFAGGIGKNSSNAHALTSGKIARPHPSTKRKVAAFFGLAPEQIFDEKIPLPSPLPPNVAGPESFSDAAILQHTRQAPPRLHPGDIESIARRVAELLLSHPEDLPALRTIVQNEPKEEIIKSARQRQGRVSQTPRQNT